MKVNFDGHEKDIGIYCIINLVNCKIYFGQTIRSFYERWDDHQYELKNNIHHNEHLQKSYNKYGINNFLFEILEVLNGKTQEEIDERENYYLNKFWDGGEYCYNDDKKARNGSGRFSEKTRRKISTSLLKRPEAIQYKNYKWLFQKYIVEKHTTYEIAKEIGITAAALKNWLKELNISRRSNCESHLENPEALKYKNYDILHQLYIKNKLSINQIANMAKTTNTTISSWIKEFKIIQRTPSESQMNNSDLFQYKNKDFLHQKYIIEQLDISKISQQIGVNIGTIWGWLDEFDIPKRPKKRNIKVYENIKLQDPDGKIYTKVECLSDFARSNNLEISKLCSVLNGKRNHHRGWKLLKEKHATTNKNENDICTS